MAGFTRSGAGAAVVAPVTFGAAGGVRAAGIFPAPPPGRPGLPGRASGRPERRAGRRAAGLIALVAGAGTGGGR
ncbi:hypothetical protein [Actinomadura macrotermitis]|uniref:hypothetical protein n=1 Tax=Actinomadura macrotermitis TaxID=2585200 RepID=UPI0012973260|nr:hypothetical protein [Actinomadura macrotermitis]